MSSLFSHGEHEDLGNGRLRTTISLKPVNYKKNSMWTRITNALGASGDPTFPIGVDELLQFRIRDKLAGQSPVLHFGKGQTHVRISPLNTANVKGVVEGRSILFPEAWPNADFRATDGGHFVELDAPLRTGHPQIWAFRIDSHAGLDLETLSTPDFRILQPVLRSPNGVDDIPLVWVVTEQGGKTILTVALPEGDWAGWTLDPTLTLQPDATDGLDVQLLSTTYDNANFGTNENLFVGERDDIARVHRSLIKFSLASLPDDAIIPSATLSLYAQLDRSSNARTFRVYRQKRAWVEGTGQNPATTGATWNNYETSTPSAWQTAGGFGANDCEQSDIGSRVFSATETLNEFKDFVLTPTTKSGLDLGNGWMIKADTEANDAYRFYSSDHTTPAQRPKLVAEYTVAEGDALFQRPFSPIFRGPFG